MAIIGVDQYLSNSALYEHRCLEIIKTITNRLANVTINSSKKEIIESAMVSTPEGFTDNSPNSSGPYVTVK